MTRKIMKAIPRLHAVRGLDYVVEYYGGSQGWFEPIASFNSYAVALAYTNECLQAHKGTAARYRLHDLTTDELAKEITL